MSKAIVVQTDRSGKRAVISVKPTVKSQTGTISDASKHLVDIIFVFDTTGSMSNKIHNLKLAMQELVDETKKLALDIRFALITFGDLSYPSGGDRIDVVVSPTADTEVIKKGIANAPDNNGFGNEGESCFEAIEQALRLELRPNTVKVMIVLTDEPALQHRIKAPDINQRLKQREFIVFTIATENQYYKDIANQNGGSWRLISANTKISDILDIFRNITKKAVQTAKRVHVEAGGDVKRFLLLNPPSNK